MAMGDNISAQIRFNADHAIGETSRAGAMETPALQPASRATRAHPPPEQSDQDPLFPYGRSQYPAYTANTSSAGSTHWTNSDSDLAFTAFRPMSQQPDIVYPLFPLEEPIHDGPSCGSELAACPVPVFEHSNSDSNHNALVSSPLTHDVVRWMHRIIASFNGDIAVLKSQVTDLSHELVVAKLELAEQREQLVAQVRKIAEQELTLSNHASRLHCSGTRCSGERRLNSAARDGDSSQRGAGDRSVVKDGAETSHTGQGTARGDQSYSNFAQPADEAYLLPSEADWDASSLTPFAANVVDLNMTEPFWPGENVEFDVEDLNQWGRGGRD